MAGSEVTFAEGPLTNTRFRTSHSYEVGRCPKCGERVKAEVVAESYLAEVKLRGREGHPRADVVATAAGMLTHSRIWHECGTPPPTAGNEEEGE